MSSNQSQNKTNEKSRDDSQVSSEVLTSEDGSTSGIDLKSTAVLNHLRQLHDKASRNGSKFLEESENELRERVRRRVDHFNAALRNRALKIYMNATGSCFSGSLLFRFCDPSSGKNYQHMLALNSDDTIGVILPSLREIFGIGPDLRLCVIEKINDHEILLDAAERPLDLAVNANSPVTFNVVAGPDRTAEILRGLQTGQFTPSQKRKLLQKFNIDDDMMSASDFGGTRTSQSSASESTGRADSLEGSPIPNERGRNKSRPSMSHVKSFGRNREFPSRQQPDRRNTHQMPNEKNKTDKSNDVFSVTTFPKGRNGKMEAKQTKRPQAPVNQRPGRDQGVSASARRIFSSLRKTGRGRSSSRERNERQSPTKSPSVSECAPHDDLSSDANLPGILKIFGDAVSPGAKYKSVLATRQSKARELVKAALERYGISRSMGRKYVLCEVVGRIREEKVDSSLSQDDIIDETFVEDYVRPLNDHEKPLILQSYWKPLDGYARRFELRDRSQVLDQITTEKDRETKDVNAQAKRLIIKSARLSRTQSSLSLKMIAPDSSTSEEEEEDRRKELQSREKKNMKERNNNNLDQESPPTPSQFADNEQDLFLNGSCKDFPPFPFLLTLQGEDGIKSETSTESGGSLVHHLDTKVTVIGRDQSELPSHDQSTGASKDINIKLAGDDIKTHHCVVYRVKSDGEMNSQNSPWKVTLHLVADDCAVTVNGQPIASDEEVHNGDIITIGAKYIFMFKDPTSKNALNSNMRIAGFHTNSNRLGGIASRGSAFTPVKKRCVDMEINYRHEHEDSVLEVIFAAANDIIASSSSKLRPENCDRELAPARFLIHCIEQSCFNFTPEQKKSLLFVLATNLQTILLDATANVSMQDDSKIKNPEEGIHYILPKLEGVVFWMSNTLEIFSYLQTDVTERVKARVKKEMDLNEVDSNLLNEAAGFRVTDDVLAVLEEIVMYAFQQLVYYLTKTLYGALPKILDTNPFAEVNEDSTSSVRGTGHVTAIYSAALGLTRKYGVHPVIESQLFAYLFFFTNVSLFNTLMEDDAVNKYYRWDKGVQIRGNLEEIECWANDHGFSEQAAMFLEKISALTNLLATTKTQMLQSTWTQFRRDFPSLNPAQLRHVLNGYVLGPRIRKRPSEWLPDPEDLEEASESDILLESYDNHPPLVLPNHGTQIDLDHIPQDSWYSIIRDAILAVGQGHKFEVASTADSWLANPEMENAVGERQQPDGHEIPIAQHHSHSPATSSTSSIPGKHTRKMPAKSDKERLSVQVESVDSSKQSGRQHSPSSTSISSMLSDSASQASFSNERRMPAPLKLPKDSPLPDDNDATSPKPAPRKSVSSAPVPSPRVTKSSQESKSSRGAKTNRSTTKYATLDRPRRKHKQRQSSKTLIDDESCDYKSLISGDTQTSSAETQGQSVNYSISTNSDSSSSMPSEVFIVDVVRGKKGLGLGLIDGMRTSLQVPGIFVRSLVPDGPSVKHVHMKHQEIIKCWLQEGRLLLGDRILAVNGTSLVSMDYASAIEELRQPGEHLRFLVGRSSADIAMKISSSSC